MRLEREREKAMSIEEVSARETEKGSGGRTSTYEICLLEVSYLQVKLTSSQKFGMPRNFLQGVR